MCKLYNFNFYIHEGRTRRAESRYYLLFKNRNIQGILLINIQNQLNGIVVRRNKEKERNLSKNIENLVNGNVSECIEF